MCGFLGTAGPIIDASLQRAVVDIANVTTAHRGPDAMSTFFDNRVAMSCYRLYLNGGTSGDQPCFSGDDAVLYNGETYYLDGAPVAVSATEGDTRAVADHLARGRGPEALDGMFAIARWQREAGALQLWRDRFGVKPLYWGPTDDGVAFGSRAAGVRHLCRAGGVPGEAVVAYLSLRGPFADQDLFEGVHAVAPGGWMAWDAARGATSGRWWEPPASVDADGPASTDELEEVLLAAVDAALQADAGVGLCLSGGVDSSLLVAMARHLRGPDIATYILSSDTNQDDVVAAREVARHLGITPRVVDMRADWPDALEHLVPLLDEPPTTESTLGVAALAAAARADGLTALVSGEGADEVFGGYEEYRTRAFTLDDQLPEGRWLRTHLQPWLHDDIERFEQRVVDKLARHREGSGNPGTFDLESRLARLLRRLDSAMMAHAVEGRVPYLVDTVATAGMSRSWPERTAGLGKQALRDVARRWLPPWVCERPKRPFASGVRRRPEVVRQLLLRAQGALADVVTPESLQVALDDPSQPQAWKVAALGAFLAVHGVGVASGVPS
jgi:asparagine synthase (glutamine-hydrolysing)